jgi:hypothetical protein
MTTAYRAYQEPVDALNRDCQEEHTYDREIERLHAQDEQGAHPHDPDHRGAVVCLELDQIKAWMEARQSARQEATHDQQL